jgi:hypothetical protein
MLMENEADITMLIVIFGNLRKSLNYKKKMYILLLKTKK